MKSGPPYSKAVSIPADGRVLPGDMVMPEGMIGMVLFSHGSGSSRHSPRNRMVASRLHDRKIGTLLFDLLTAEEDRTYETRFDIELLAQRLDTATGWLRRQPGAEHCRLGYFGASTGAASALIAAALRPDDVAAVVSRGGRPDLAMPMLNRVKAPTLLIVGGEDAEVLELNEHAFAQLAGVKQLEIVPGATHLFEEEGKMEQVAQLAGDWFERYFVN